MKLAEALLLRSEYQKKIDNLQQRVMFNLKIQDGDKPSENPDDLLAEIIKLNDEMCQLIKKINKCNNDVKLDNGQTLTEALVDRDSIMKKRQILNAITMNAAQKDFRITHAEIKINMTLDIGEIQREIDSLSQQFRKIDTQIQAKNWLVDLE